MIGPPKGISPARLFRLLLQTPRASVPVRISFAGIEGGAFRVCALSTLDVLEARDAVPADVPEVVRGSVVGAELAARALYDEDGERVFLSGDALGQLDELEAKVVLRAVLDAIDTCSPSYGRSDIAAWTAALQAGARAPENRGLTLRLGGCVEAAGKINLPRPDRFFGIPLHAFTDGQWLAFGAARAVFLSVTK